MAIANRSTGANSSGNTVARGGSPPRLPLVSRVLGALTLLGMLLSIWMIFLYAPTDAIEGQPRRIFYFHVPISWIGMLAFVVLTIASVTYLITRDERWDWLACASAEIGTVFITLALITGSIWGKTTWGTWWSWDPKLTATLLLWFMYVAYLMVRSYMGRTQEAARIGAVLSIVGVVDVPIIYLSVQWWRTLHPQPVVATGNLPVEMLITLMVALVTFTLFYALLMIQLYQLQRLQTLAQRLRVSVE